MKKAVIDTNAYTRFLAGDEQAFAILAGTEIVYMSIFVIGELYAGFRGGRRRQKNEEVLREFLNRPTVKILNATTDTSEIFGRIKHDLRSAGTHIPINDIWIAPHVFEVGALLVTYDQYFKAVPGLKYWDFIDSN